MKNQMEIESLLNRVGESHILTETSDQEIYQAVIDSIAACENIKINSEDNVDIDDMPSVLRSGPVWFFDPTMGRP